MTVVDMNFDFGAVVEGEHNSLDRTRRYVYAEESHIFKVIDSSLGFVLTDCL